MDLATLIGTIGIVLTITLTIMFGGNVLAFIDLPSLLLVVVGTLLITLIRWDFQTLSTTIKIIPKVFLHKKNNINELISTCLLLASNAQKEGILALDKFELIDHPLLKDGIQLLIEGHEQQQIHAVLSKDLQMMQTRHQASQKLLEHTAETSLAMGIIGTIIGLIQMLSNMNDPRTLGPAMAMTLLSVFYSFIIANIICTPLAEKLAYRDQMESLLRNIIIDALNCIQSGQALQITELKLKSYVEHNLRAKIFISDVKPND